jgi:hypothetical protein
MSENRVLMREKQDVEEKSRMRSVVLFATYFRMNKTEDKNMS